MIFAISDIHAHKKQLKEWIEAIGVNELKSGKHKLILLGDYIDRGPDSYGVLQMIYDYQQCFGDNLVALRGNHEEWFLDYMHGIGDEWLVEDCKLQTSRTFLKQEQLEKVQDMALNGRVQDVYEYIINCINENHKTLMKWLNHLPYFYETENQIYVHAGIDEEAGDLWKYGTAEFIFTGKYPPTKGKFLKDIIAGHVWAKHVSRDKNHRGVFYDGMSHFYIDGSVARTKQLLCLAYDEDSGAYYDVKFDAEGSISTDSYMRIK